jgi:hypothetical protein
MGGQSTPRRQRIRSALAAVGLVAVVLLATAGCAGDPPPRTVEIVVPAGTQERLSAGETVEVMPARLDLRVGDTLLIRNEDSVTQSVGPYLVAANSEYRLTYGSPGRFEGYCPLSEGQRYEIVVAG